MNLSEVKHLPKVDHTPAELDEPSRILMGAADVIDKRGLHKGAFCENAFYDSGAVCVLGGMLAAVGIQFFEPWTPALIAAEVRFGERVGGHIPQWNDAPERTKDEVVAKLRAVALGL